MQPNTAKQPSHITLALMRPDGKGGVNFFVPLEGYGNVMCHLLVDNPFATARRMVKAKFKINPRGNARLFRLTSDWVVVFDLTASEAGAIDIDGAWLPARLITDPAAAQLLLEVTERL